MRSGSNVAGSGRRGQRARDLADVAALEDVDGLADRRREIGGARAQREVIGVEVRDVEEIVDEVREAPHLRARERQVLRRHGLAREQLALDELQRHARAARGRS